MQDIGSLGDGFYGLVSSINNQSQMVGYTFSPDNPNQDIEAFIYSGGSRQNLGTLGGRQAVAKSINSSGQIVGDSLNSSGIDRAFLFQDGSMQDLGTLGGTSSSAAAINDLGQIVGYSNTGQPTHPGHLFLYSDGLMQDIGTFNAVTSSTTPTGINDWGEIVGWASVGLDYHAYVYSNGSAKDLNDRIVPKSGLTVEFVYGINDSGQIVGQAVNSTGEYHAVLLNPIDPNDLPTIQVGKPHPVYGNGIVQQNGKTKLVVITHGRIRPGEDPAASTAWVDTMFTSVSNYLVAHNMNDWQVATHKWIAGAQGASDLNILDYQRVLDNASMEGKNLGNSIVVSGNWTHVHLIAHSAGAELIQTCSEIIKNHFQNSCSIHCTFLDPFTGILPYPSPIFDNVHIYGDHADWSDDYFTRDSGTGGDRWPVTEGHLDHAHSVDVTYLDSHKTPLNGYVQVSGVVSEPCQKTETSHGWPIDFYMNTISGDLSGVYGAQYYLNFGFPLGLEANNWNNLDTFYPRGNNPAETLGPQDPNCVQLFQSNTGTTPSGPMDFNSGTQQPFGMVQPAGWGLNESADDPAWLAKFITLTNPVNYVAFDAWFTANPLGAGEMSVYWDTNAIGFADEALVGSGLKHYVFSFPPAAANTTHMLGLRIDAATDGSVSSISITNVIMGYVGVSQPFTLSVTTNTYNGLHVFQLSGQPGFNYKVQASTNLLNWNDIAVLVNSNGIVPFIDPDSTNYSQRFYRAVAPY